MTSVTQALQAELQELYKARDVLHYSYAKCAHVPIDSSMDPEQMESFEALTSRFARLSDIMTQKIFRYLDSIDLEESGTTRDRINRADKRGIISSAQDFVHIRMLRNEIAHEYKAETIHDIFERVLALTPVLLDSVDRVVGYVHDTILKENQ